MIAFLVAVLAGCIFLALYAAGVALLIAVLDHLAPITPEETR